MVPRIRIAIVFSLQFSVARLKGGGAGGVGEWGSCRVLMEASCFRQIFCFPDVLIVRSRAGSLGERVSPQASGDP